MTTQTRSAQVRRRDGMPVGHAGRATMSYAGPTYYDRPAVKPSIYGWLVWTYTYIAGLAGGAQIIAAIADLSGRRRMSSVVRNGRYLALAGPTIGSALLIADLHTPQRWYNMLRIFRKTSPMSFGSYILTGFGAASAATAGGHLLHELTGQEWARWTARAAQVPAAFTGAGMGIYTGALLTATSTPSWAAMPRLLTARFACSSIATAAAALSLAEQLWGDRRNNRTLDRIALVATLAESVFGAAAGKAQKACGISAAGASLESRLASGIGEALPLLCYGLKACMPQRSRQLSMLASLGVLAGGLLMRSSVFHVGNESARRPRDYFGFTQPQQHAERLPMTEREREHA